EVLEANRFRERGNQLIELSFALGTGALVEFHDGDNINIDYVTADKIYPITAENGEITECAFCSMQLIGGKRNYYINVHRKDENGMYRVENYMFDEHKKRTALLEGVQDVIETKSDIPLFQIIRPNVTSNICIDAVMGMSIYANALDVLKTIDVVYDSYRNEFVLGKKRLIVPLSMAQFHDNDGQLQPMFDANDTAFYGLPSNGDEDKKIVEIDMNLRAAEHDAAMRQNLNMLSEICGFGPGRYDFERTSGVKTATEVISEKSDLFRSLKKHELVVERALCGMIRAILFLDGKNPDAEIEIDFDDSIIEDRQKEFSERLQMVTAGVSSKVEMRMWYFNETEEQAKKAISAIPGDEEEHYPEE
ncbi:MAG: phage portal protein, partial [Clostridia bacterium]|nr:phage portal protein [Clostridia bacterium]